MGGIVDTVSHLFGVGSADRGAKRATDAQGNDLNLQNQTYQQEIPWLQKAGGAVDRQGGMVGNMAAPLQGMGNSLEAQLNAALQQYRQGGLQAGAYNSTFPNAYKGALAADGFNADGTVNPNFDPYGNGVGSSLVGQYADAASKQGDNTVATAGKDLTARGFTGGSTLAPSEIGDIRRAQTQDVGNFTRNLGVQDANERYTRMAHGINMINGVGGAASNNFGNAGSLFGNAANGFGGLSHNWGDIGNAFGNVASGYGNVAAGFGNIAGGYGNAANGQQNLNQAYQQQGNNQTQNLTNLAQMFAF